MTTEAQEDGRLYIKLYFDTITSTLYRKIGGDPLKLYLMLRRYICRARSGHSLSLFYINGYLAVSGYLGTYARLFDKSESTISRWLDELEQNEVLSTYQKGMKDGRPSIWILGRVMHVEGSEYGVEIFFLDHLASAQETDRQVAIAFNDGQMHECEAPSHTKLNSTLALLQGKMQVIMQGSNIKEVIDKKLPQPAVAGPAIVAQVVGQELEYVDLEEEETERRPKWAVPDNQEQKDMLALTGRKWFQSGEKSKTKAILGALRAGDMLENPYTECLAQIQDVPDFQNRQLPPMPRSWLEYRSGHAKQNHWSYGGFLRALLDRDKLAEHCRYKLKELGVGKQPKITEENGVRILVLEDSPPVNALPQYPGDPTKGFGPKLNPEDEKWLAPKEIRIIQ